MIIFRGIQVGLAARLPVFYGYLGWLVLMSVVQIAVAHSSGHQSNEYYYAYWVGGAVAQLFQIVVLLDVFRSLGWLKLGRVHLVVGGATLFAVPTFLMTAKNAPVYTIFTVGFALQLGLWTSALYFLYLDRGAGIDSNLAGILGGLLVFFWAEWVGFYQYGADYLPHGVFRLLVPGVFLGVLLIFLASLWRPADNE